MGKKMDEKQARTKLISILFEHFLVGLIAQMVQIKVSFGFDIEKFKTSKDVGDYTYALNFTKKKIVKKVTKKVIKKSTKKTTTKKSRKHND